MQAKTIHDAKTNLSKYIAAAKKGTEVYIGGRGNPEVKLVRVTPADLAQFAQRDFSLARGKVSAADDSFAPETDAAVSSMLYGEHS